MDREGSERRKSTGGLRTGFVGSREKEKREGGEEAMEMEIESHELLFPLLTRYSIPFAL